MPMNSHRGISRVNYGYELVGQHVGVNLRSSDILPSTALFGCFGPKHGTTTHLEDTVGSKLTVDRRSPSASCQEAEAEEGA